MGMGARDKAVINGLKIYVRWLLAYVSYGYKRTPDLTHRCSDESAPGCGAELSRSVGRALRAGVHGYMLSAKHCADVVL